MLVATSGPKSLSFTARLFSLIAAAVEAIGHRLVLQIAFAALIADRAIERMVDQQELHHAVARLPAPSRCRYGSPCRRRSRHGAGGDRLRRLFLLRPGTCGNCRRSPAARGSRNAALRCRPAGRPAAPWRPPPTSTSMPLIGQLRHGLLRRLCRRVVAILRDARAPSPAGNGGSGPGPARPRRRRARRWCGLRSR